ncbi:ankyrin repeat and fibronectin type-III domain-containing protein 1 isoform X3 [Pungitius pungitius]|uniref:ankyrin repeat and fibronectin type-III domain-containing protein 1 isoform X3 n=1 Tax=Pungitius pungitius TaxID=134920 RepID=UPI002E165388
MFLLRGNHTKKKKRSEKKPHCFRRRRRTQRRSVYISSPGALQTWLKMSQGSEKSCVLLSLRGSRTSCILLSEDEKDDPPGAGEESVLEMLSCSKFSGLESWLCMPSSLLLPSAPDPTRTSSSSHASSQPTSSSSSSPSSNSRLSTCSDPGETDTLRLWDDDSSFLPPVSSTPAGQSPPPSSSAGGGIRKRRRLAASPGGLHWTSAGLVQRDWSPDPSPLSGENAAAGRAATPPLAEVGGATWGGDRAALRLLSRLDRGRKKVHGIQSLGASGRYDSRRKSDSRISWLAHRWNQRASGDDLIRDLKPLSYTADHWSSLSLDSRSLPVVMTQQMQNLQLTQNRKCPGGPASPSAAKRLYRNLSEKLRGSSSSFEDAYFFGKTDRLRKASTMQGGDCLFEAVEQQDLDAVQILLYQFSAEELDLNTPNNQGLTPLDIAVMTNNTPIAKLLLKAGAKESPHFLSPEGREAHLSALVLEAEQRASELASQAQMEGVSLEVCQRDRHLRAWEWRSKLYRRMAAGLQHARTPETPSMVRLSVSTSTSLMVSFQEPLSLNSTVVTKYKVEWSCLKDFSLLAGEIVLDNLQTLKCIISNLTTGRLYYVRVSAYNMRGWGPPSSALPPSAAPSSWRDSDGQAPRRRSHIEAMERLLQQVRATHTHYCCGDTSKLQNPSRKQSVSRSLKHLFNSSNKFVKTLKRGVYLAAVFHHKDSLLVTAEDQIPIVEVDDSYSSSLTQDFLWFTKLSCMWEDVRWLRQSMLVSMSSSSTLQARHKMLSAANQLQNLLGTHNLGRVHYEPIKDRHGNVLLVTIREVESQHSLLSGKWMLVTKLQSQRKSLSTPEEPYALDILIITIQDILAYQRRSTHRLAPGLYLGYLKLSSSVDQIRVLVSQRTPNMLCHSRIRENANVSKEEWDWIRSLSAAGDQGEEAEPRAESHTPLLYYELQTSIRSLLKLLNLPLAQARLFRLYSQEVVELGHGVSFLLLLPAADDVCSAPGQSNPYTPLSGFLHLPLQMFELVHFCSYKEKFISLYCRLSSVLDLDALITQQALREAITDSEVATAKQRHQLVLDYIQQLDEMRRDLRWITDALQSARYKQPAGVPVSRLVDASEAESRKTKTSSTSSTTDFLPTPSPSPELHQRMGVSEALGSDEDESSEVFLPTDSDYDSSEALSPRELDLLYSPPQDLSQQALHSLGGSAPDVLQIHELRYSVCPPADLPLPPLLPQCLSRTSPADPCLSLPLSPALCDTTRTLEGLQLSERVAPPLPQPGAFANPPVKRKLLSRSHRGQYFSGPQRWLRAKGGEETLTGCLSEGVYTKQPDLPPPRDATFVSHASCVLESRKGRQQEQRPHVRRIFVEPRHTGRSWEEEEVKAEEGAGLEGCAAQEVDSDDQTNAQVSEILSSSL